MARTSCRSLSGESSSALPEMTNQTYCIHILHRILRHKTHRKRLEDTLKTSPFRAFSLGSFTGTLRNGDVRARSPCLLSLSRIKVRAFQGLGGVQGSENL